MIAKAKLLKQSIPVIVGWALTYQCNKQCKYCLLPIKKTVELNTAEVKLLIDNFKRLGTKMLIFTGGEPFLRKDIIEIINYAKQKRMIVYVNSNGSRIRDFIGQLGLVDCLNISLEGNKQTHNAIRGTGSFEQVMESAELAKQHKIKLRFTTTLNKLNLENIDYILDSGANLQAKVKFQILTDYCLGSVEKNPLLPENHKLIKVIKQLCEYKKKGKYKNIIANPLPALKYFRSLPKLPLMACASGKITFRVTPDGFLITCGESGIAANHFRIALKNKTYEQVKQILEKIKFSKQRCSCGCADRVEASMLWNLNPGAVLNRL